MKTEPDKGLQRSGATSPGETDGGSARAPSGSTPKLRSRATRAKAEARPAKAAKILILEDVETDAELELRQVRDCGINAITKRVATRQDFIAALEEFSPDIVLSDYSLPDLDGFGALEIVRGRSIDLPFILVTGVLNDEAATKLFRSGMTDYVLKDHLAKLGPAVRRALAEAEEIGRRKSVERGWDEFARSIKDVRYASFGVAPDGAIASWNDGAAQLYGYAGSEMIGKPVVCLMVREQAQLGAELIDKIGRGVETPSFATKQVTKAGKVLDILLRVSPVRGGAGELVGAAIIAHDVTAIRMPERVVPEERLPADMKVPRVFATAEVGGGGLPVRAAPVPLASAEPVPFDPDAARAETLDRLIHAWQAQTTLSISPAALQLAFWDWAVHLANAPGKQRELVVKALRKWTRFQRYLARRVGDPDCPPSIEPLPQDRRFSDPSWHGPPFDAIYQSFLLIQQWWHNASVGLRGVEPAHERVVEFAMRQMLDVFSPSNFPWSNPQVIRATVSSGGRNFLNGFANLVEDWERIIGNRRPAGAEEFVVGKDVAITPGKVVFRNDLIELIQYEPATPTVRLEPVLIVPAWIMKYYVLDLSPENSLVRYMVGHGLTVFMISWRNPTSAQRDLGLEEYRRLGVEAALDAIYAICPGARVHGCGYCLGGTLLAIEAARAARDGDLRLASLTLLASETDFAEAGELMLFINESQVTYLEDVMWELGYLDARQMAGTFQLLRSNDLIWSQMISEYLLGERPGITDVMAWSTDTTRMPYRMHSEYLRRLFLRNDLAGGRLEADGRPVNLSDVRIPVFAVGTEYDNIVPWRSAYKIHGLTEAEITFVLTTGGHNVGILSAVPSTAADPARRYQIARSALGGRRLGSETWLATAEKRAGSWGPAWLEWLDAHTGDPVAARRCGAAERGYPALADAPGRYVLEQ